MKKVIAGILIAALTAAAGLVTAVCICAGKDRKAVPSDCIIVLGARVWPDGRMSNTLLYRCESALNAWKNGISENIIVCGARGDNEPMTEAFAMKRYFTANGVPADKIIEEDRSFSTEQNLSNAAALMKERKWESAAVVTSDYHVERSLWLARDAGIRACGISAKSPDRLTSKLLSRLREPMSWVLYFIRRTVR